MVGKSLEVTIGSHNYEGIETNGTPFKSVEQEPIPVVTTQNSNNVEDEMDKLPSPKLKQLKVNEANWTIEQSTSTRPTFSTKQSIISDNHTATIQARNHENVEVKSDGIDCSIPPKTERAALKSMSVKGWTERQIPS